MIASGEIFCSEIFHAADMPYLNIISIRRRKIVFSQYKFRDKTISKTFINENIKSKWQEYTSDVDEVDQESIEEHQNYLEDMLFELRRNYHDESPANCIRSPNVMIDLSTLLSVDNLPTIKKSAFDALFIDDITNHQNDFNYLCSYKDALLGNATTHEAVGT